MDTKEIVQTLNDNTSSITGINYTAVKYPKPGRGEIQATLSTPQALNLLYLSSTIQPNAAYNISAVNEVFNNNSGFEVRIATDLKGKMEDAVDKILADPSLLKSLLIETTDDLTSNEKLNAYMHKS